VTDPEILQFFDPAVEIRQSASFFGTEGTFHGYEGLQRSAREVFEVFRELCWVPMRIVDSGERVVATVEARGFGKHSRAAVNERLAHVWTLRGGRITSWHIHMDISQAFEEAGVPEDGP
jgi:ketosteroid isomerase-like protein